MVATNDIGAEVARLLTGPRWSGHRVIEVGSMVSADEVAKQLGEVLSRRQDERPFRSIGWDAVISLLSSGLRNGLGEVSLLIVPTGALVTAMTRNGMRRLACIGALGARGQPAWPRAAAFLGVVAFAAILVPTLKAARSDPMVAIRCD